MKWKTEGLYQGFFSLKGTQRYITAQHVFIDKWDLFSLTTMGWQYWAHSSNPSLLLESGKHIASESFNIILHPCQHSHFLWCVSGDNRITPPNVDPNYFSLNIVTFMESLSILWKQWALNKTFIFCQSYCAIWKFSVLIMKCETSQKAGFKKRFMS